MNLNPGGGIGSAIGGIGALVVVLIVAKGEPNAVGDKAYLIIPALIIGSVVGNLLWEAIFGKPQPKDDNRRSHRYDDDDDDRPRRKRPSNRYNDEDEDDDRPRRKYRNDDDEDDRPRRKRRDRED